MKHKLIHTPDYLIAVDDSKIKEDCVAIHLGPLGEQEIVIANGECKLDKKIIAHLPLNNSPILEGVDLLPPFSRHQEDGIRSLAREQFPNDGTVDSSYLTRGFIKGYNKAKEKYKYTEEDMKIAIQQAFLSGVERLEDFEKVEKMTLENIQSLTQPKMPVEFECEMDCTLVGLNLADKCTVKITTTSECHCQLVGKYIY